MLVAGSRAVMGDRVNRWPTNLVGWAAVAIMLAAAIGLIVTL